MCGNVFKLEQQLITVSTGAFFLLRSVGWVHILLCYTHDPLGCAPSLTTHAMHCDMSHVYIINITSKAIIGMVLWAINHFKAITMCILWGYSPLKNWFWVFHRPYTLFSNRTVVDLKTVKILVYMLIILVIVSFIWGILI